MKYVCISAANVEAARHTSASLQVCQIVAERLVCRQPDAQVEIVPLLDYELRSCRMCGECLGRHTCTRDADFNRVFAKMCGADALFFVVPHYAPLPSKLMILTEKMEEMAFLGWVADPNYRFPLADRPVGIIAHGGQSAPEALPYYQRMLVAPVAMALASCQMRVVGAGEEGQQGVVFGITDIKKRPNSPFVDIFHDWKAVEQRIAPLVDEVAAALETAQ